MQKKHGLDGILITSGEESVHTALEQADLLGASMIQKDSNEALLQRAFEQSNEMFFIMNRNGHVLKKSPHFIHTYDQTTLERFIRKAKSLLKQEISSTVILSKDAYIQLQIKPFTHENEKK